MAWREEHIGAARLILGDCRDILPTLGKVDACVTDPPYGLDFRGEEWDAEIPDWLPAARAVAPVVAFTTAPTTLWDYPRPDWVSVWYRPASSARAASGGFNAWSPIVIYGRVKFPVDVLELHAIANAYERGFGHPSPKPIILMDWLVENAAKSGAIVLDPFMGSGTTGVACAKLGRRFIGIEIEPKYFDIACRRIDDAYRQADLFIKQPEPLGIKEKA